jgi:hypothetical protein
MLQPRPASDYIDPIEAQAIMDAHDENCDYRVSALCAIPVECEHGYDVCPRCDVCTCRNGGAMNEQDERAVRLDKIVKEAAAKLRKDPTFEVSEPILREMAEGLVRETAAACGGDNEIFGLEHFGLE